MKNIIQNDIVKVQKNPINLEPAAGGGNDASLNPDDTDDWLNDRLYMV